MEKEELFVDKAPNTIPAVDSATEKKQTFTEHGSDIKEIISFKPPLLVRWGTVLFSLLLLLLASLCWFIQYPDLVLAKGKLKSVNAPKSVVTRTEGQLIKILVDENEKVRKGQALGFIESIANPESVIEINKQLDSISMQISAGRIDEIISYFPDYTNHQLLNNLGELQSAYQVFNQSFITFRDFLSSGFFLKKRALLATDLQNIQKLHTILITQKELMKQDLSLTNQTYAANESLAKDQVISSFEYRNEKSKLIAKQLTLPQINAAIVSNESQQNEKRKEIAELENQIITQKNNFLQALRTMKSQVQSWEYKHMLKAPVAGKVAFTSFFQENQEMKAGQALFYIQPDNSSYFIEILIPQFNFGKVKEGQKVMLKFEAYPHEQYGIVMGKIESIKTLPIEGGYLAKVTLPHGLKTNYNKPLKYQDGLEAQAEIITEDMRLLERFYYDFFKQVKLKR